MPKIRKKKRNGQILEKQKYQNTRKEIYNLYSLFWLNRYYILLNYLPLQNLGLYWAYLQIFLNNINLKLCHIIYKKKFV